MIPRDVGLQATENKALSRGIIGKSAPPLTEITIRKSQVCTLLHNVGFSFQKARFVSDHLDEAKRLVWLEEKWPAIFRGAKRRHGLILFEDEASFAQWGSLSYTWARRGQQPEVKTSGKRKGYK